MFGDPVLSLAVLAGLDASLLVVGALALTKSRGWSGPRLVACSCGQSHCTAVRQVEAVWPS